MKYKVVLADKTIVHVESTMVCFYDGALMFYASDRAASPDQWVVAAFAPGTWASIKVETP